MIFIGIPVMDWLIVIEAILLVACVASESNWLAALSIIGFGLGVHYLAKIELIEWAKANWLYAVEVFAAYLAVGLLWGLAKWMLHVRDVKKRYVAFRDAFFKDNKITDLSDPKMKEEFNTKARRALGELPPSAADHKAEIVGWISYWPASVFWSLFSDLLTKIFRELYSLCSGLFQKIANRQFKEFKDDLKE